MKKLFTLLIALAICSEMFAQEIGTTYTPVVSQSTYFDVSLPIRDIAIAPMGASAHHQWKNKVVENKFTDKHILNPDDALPIGEDPSWQKEFGAKGITTPIQNFEGIRNSDNGAPAEWLSPPDTDGDVGPNHYFQMCNVIFQIFDKSGTSLLGPLDNSTIWSGFVGAWTGTNDGDPIILYDEQADRWLVSQFAVNTTNGTYWELVAISTTGDPTGSYYRYAFQFTSFPDYPKFGIWRDGYYIMVQHGTAAGNVTAASFNRTQMIAGNPTAQMVSFAMPNLPGGGFIGMLPSDNDGAWAPIGAPNYFMYFSDDVWGDDPVDRLKVWEFSVNWTTPALSTLVLTTNLNTDPFDSYFGSFFSGWITQPGTTQKLATQEGALMNRLQYRNFGTYQSMLCCHAIDVNGLMRAGMRWYELRKTTGAWYIYQQGTYSPGSTDNYWMGSIAQNGLGDIALGFSVSSSSTYPSIRYTGRNAGDPLGVMTLAEQTIFAGTVSQYGTHRWGDYTMMSVDPSDDRTFWYTNEYINSSAWSDWVTRIASFSLGRYCAAGGGCEEYISQVQFGSINKSSGCNGYADYTGISTNLQIGASATLTVNNGLAFTGDQCGVWIDWNNDGDFLDANETITVSGTPGLGPYTASISSPAGTSSGAKTMRIRITYTGSVSSCGTTPYGEVEDYTINLTGTPGLWAGTVSTDWNNPLNWNDGNLPTSTINVTIPTGTPYQPVILNGTSAYAASIFLNSGATLTQNSSSWFYVYGTFDAGFGQFTMNGITSYLYLRGSTNSYWYDDYQDDTYSTVVIYKDNTAATVNMQTNMNCNRLMEVYFGTLSLNNTVLTCSSTLSPAFSVRNGGKIILDSSSDAVNVAGSVLFENGSQASLTNGTIRCGGDFNVNSNTSYEIAFTGGTLIMNGSSTQYINDLDGGNLDLFNLNIEKTAGTCYIKSANLDVNSNMTISGGALSCDNGPSPTATYNINIAGNWINSVGAAGFAESSSRVIFDGGAYHQNCSNETFNILEVNKAAGGAFRPYLDNNVICAAYDWTAGAVDVITGSFTANDLLDNGIFGAYYCNPGGTINLNNLLGNLWVDLNAELHIYGGTVNISGSVSDWPYASNASIEMSGGVLDFKTCGININNTSYTLTNNITGGTIRTAYGFSGNRADFTPTAGIFEFYSSGDGYISQSNGCTLFDVVINKATKEAMLSPLNSEIAETERIDITKGNGSKTNSIFLSSNFIINNNLTISSGTLFIGPYTLTAAKTVDIYGGLTMTDPAGVFNAGTLAYDNMWFRSGSSANLAAGNINVKSWLAVDAGASFFATTGNTIHVIGGNTSGGLGNSEPSAVFGNIEINKSITSPSYCASDYTGPYNISGNLTVQANNSFQIGTNSMHVNGFMTDQTSSNVYLYYADKNINALVSPGDSSVGDEYKSGSKGGSLIIDTDYTLNGLLDVSDGSVLVHGIFHLATTGNLNITSGSFIADSPLHAKGWEYIDGHIGLTSGLFEISNNSINFSASATTSMSGGIMRSGEAFGASSPGTFQPTGGTVEIVGVGQNYIYCTSGNYFYNLLINRDPAAGSYLATNITVNNNLTVNSGTMNLYSLTANILGGVTLNGGNLLVTENSNLLMSGGTALNVNNGGKLSVIGLSGTPGRVSRISTGYYSLNVNSGGTIAAQYGTFEYMNTNGINLVAGSIVDPVYSFHRCTFQNGQAAGRLMSVENNQIFNVESAVFPTNTWAGAYNVYKSVNAGTVNFITATGGFAGESYDYDPNNRVNWSSRTLSLKTYLEGPFNGTNMNTTINGILPLSHPFNVTLPYFGGTPKWYYTGAGSVGAIPNVNIVDWVLLDIRDAASAAAATSATSVAKVPAFILSNGNIVALDGVSSPQISNSIANNLFVVIFNRNHEGIMNANPIPYASGTYAYDYSTGSGQVYGGTSGQKLLGSGIWGMRSGDGNGDGSATIFDKTSVWGLPSQAGKTGYLPSDFNFDRQTNNKDKDDKWFPNLGSGSTVPN